MKTTFKIGITVLFRHDFFTDGKLRTITVQPVPATQQVLLNHGLLVKPVENGFHLLYEETLAGRERQREAAFPPDTVLRFRVENSDRFFFNYTVRFDIDISDQVFYFKTEPALPATDGKAVYDVQREHLVPAAQFNDSGLSKPFAIIDIVPHAKLEQLMEIRFAGYASVWNYVLVQEHLQGLAKPAIINKDTKEAFDGPKTVTLPGNTRALSFRSPGPLPLREKASRAYQLIDRLEGSPERFKVIVPILPNPDIRNMTMVSTIGGPGISAIIL